MAQVNARQWQRFSYRADVQLRWTASESERDVQDCVCVNLGRGGMQVRAVAAPDVGAAISCKLLFAGAWTTLPGRVRWRRTQTDAELANELGIEFGPLSDQQNESICELVASAEHGGRAVKLRTGALRDALDAIAVPTDRGLRVRAPLRLFAPGSELDVELSDAALTFNGRVVSAQLRPRAGEQHWELDLLIEDREAPRSRRFTMYDDTPAAPPAAIKRRTRADTIMVPRPGRWHAAAWWLTSLLAAAVVIGLVVQLLASSGRPPRHLETPAPTLPPVAASVRGVPTVTSAAKLASTPSVAAAARTPKHANPVEMPSTEAPPTALAASSPNAAPQPSGTDQVLADSVQYVADEPTLKVTGDTSEVFVPVRGSLEGLHVAVWVEPLALVIDLPAGAATLTRSRYALHAGGITMLNVGRSHGVTQLRLFLDALLSRYSTQAVTGGLLVRLKRDLRPLP